MIAYYNHARLSHLLNNVNERCKFSFAMHDIAVSLRYTFQ